MMHHIRLALLIPIVAASLLHAEENQPRQAGTVILDETAVKNLRIETVEVEETAFDETVFALGHIEVLPGRRAVVSSRIPGRAFSVLALPDQQVDEGDELMWVESRQPGDPPPTVMIAAPISGLIARVDIAVGQSVSPELLLMEIVDLDIVEASARVPQHLIGKLAKGQRAQIRVQGLLDQVFEAEMAHIGAYADAESGTIEAAFHVQNPEHLLRPEMRAEFSIVVSSREGVMSIPRAAVQSNGPQRFVYVADFELENAFVKTPVVLGAQNDRTVEVIEGLLPGDEVVTSGAYSLAFAGKGNVSLKEALDAAHGHAHADDGSELGEGHNKDGKEAHHDHDHHDGWSTITSFFAASTGLLLLLVIVLSFTLRKRIAPDVSC